MRVLVAPDSFKGTLTAPEATAAIARGLKRLSPPARIRCLPLADGGEGTVDVVVSARGGHVVWAEVHDPLGRPVRAPIGILPDGTAVVEMASASGLGLLAPRERDPLRASSFGTGELLLAALERSRRVVLGLGGSATVDGGLGAAVALGARALDAGGRPVPLGGGGLSVLSRLDVTGLQPLVHGASIRLACDVTNPLVGERGAARVFGPQKGADPGQVVQLARGLEGLATLLEDLTGQAVARLPGAGAAGGVGAMLAALLGADLVPGADLVLNVVEFDRRAEGCSLILTGEGRADAQTLDGKLPMVVAGRGRRAGIPVALVAGMVDKPARPRLERFFDVIIDCHPESEFSPSVRRAAERITRRVEESIERLVSLRSQLDHTPPGYNGEVDATGEGSRQPSSPDTERGRP